MDINSASNFLDFRINVVSHDQFLLESIPDRPFLSKILLTDLNLPLELRGESLAESRFLVTNNLVEGNQGFIGFISARWNQRFPDWPSIENLDQLFAATLPPQSNQFIAPIGFKFTGRQVENWLKIQDLLHPGIEELIRELIGYHNISFHERQLYNLVMGNNFFVSKACGEELLSFWQESFAYLFGKYQLNFPYKYRCHRCGAQSEKGIGRWTDVRHAGFMMERVTALFFLSRPDLIPIGWKNGSLVEIKNKTIYRGVGIGFKASTFLERHVLRRMDCRAHQDIRRSQ